MKDDNAIQELREVNDAIERLSYFMAGGERWAGETTVRMTTGDRDRAVAFTMPKLIAQRDALLREVSQVGSASTY